MNPLSAVNDMVLGAGAGVQRGGTAAITSLLLAGSAYTGCLQKVSECGHDFC